MASLSFHFFEGLAYNKCGVFSALLQTRRNETVSYESTYRHVASLLKYPGCEDALMLFNRSLNDYRDSASAFSGTNYLPELAYFHLIVHRNRYENLSAEHAEMAAIARAALVSRSRWKIEPNDNILFEILSGIIAYFKYYEDLLRPLEYLLKGSRNLMVDLTYNEGEIQELCFHMQDEKPFLITSGSVFEHVDSYSLAKPWFRDDDYDYVDEDIEIRTIEDLEYLRRKLGAQTDWKAYYGFESHLMPCNVESARCRSYEDGMFQGTVDRMLVENRLSFAADGNRYGSLLDLEMKLSTDDKSIIGIVPVVENMLMLLPIRRFNPLSPQFPKSIRIELSDSQGNPVDFTQTFEDFYKGNKMAIDLFMLHKADIFDCKED